MRFPRGSLRRSIREFVNGGAAWTEIALRELVRLRSTSGYADNVRSHAGRQRLTGFANTFDNIDEGADRGHLHLG